MPARNIDHEAVVQALRAEGWTVTHDPLRLQVGERRLYVDVGAECVTIGAERGSQRIAVEIQSFVGDSPVRDLQEAVGQFVVYRVALAQEDPDRTLFLGVPDEVYDTVLTEPLGQLVTADARLRFLVFNAQQQKVVRWIS